MGAGMLTQSKCENRANYVWWGCVCVSASNFFGDWAVHTRSFFSLNTDHHGATTFFLFFRNSKRHFYE